MRSIMRQSTVFEMIASEEVIRPTRYRSDLAASSEASASHLDGNWLAAAAFIGIADAAERQWASCGCR
jgi:hypothetical protein